jgi:Na+-driven multidrug efflux pump
MNGLANVVRGAGNMLVPALVICIGVVVLVPLSPLLIFGIGPFPALESLIESFVERLSQIFMRRVFHVRTIC